MMEVKNSTNIGANFDTQLLKTECAFVGNHQPSHRGQTVFPVFISFICQNTFDGRHNFIYIIRENLRKPYLLRVNHHMRTVSAKPHTS